MLRIVRYGVSAIMIVVYGISVLWLIATGGEGKLVWVAACGAFVAAGVAWPGEPITLFGMSISRRAEPGPIIRPAGPFWRLVFEILGCDGVTTPWRVVYILPEVIDDMPLRVHEIMHVAQIERDGVIRFSVMYLWWLISVGYWASPYEVEARKMAHFLPKWLIENGKTDVSEARLLEYVRTYVKIDEIVSRDVPRAQSTGRS